MTTSRPASRLVASVLIAMATAVVAILVGLGVWGAMATLNPGVGALCGVAAFIFLAWLGLRLANSVRDGGRS